MLKPLIHTVTFRHVSALKGPTCGSANTLCEQAEHNACLDVNIRLKSSVLYIT